MNGSTEAAPEDDSKQASIAATSLSTTEETNTTSATPLPPATEIRIAVGSTNPCKLQAVKMALERVFASRSSSSSSSSPSSQNNNNHYSNSNIHLDIQGFEVASDVSVQPVGDDETRRGAQNRARAAYHAYKEKFNKVPHFSIGLEGGIEITNFQPSEANVTDNKSSNNNKMKEQQDVWCMAWMAVYGKRQALLADLVAASTCHHYYGDKRPIFGLAKTASFILPPAVAHLVVQQGYELGDADDQVFGRKQSKHGAGTVGILTDFLIPRAAYYEHALIMALMPWIRPDLYPHGNSSSY